MLAWPQGDRYDLAVLGGGIMGLACVFEETLRGKRVVVIDPNPIGHKASWAAAGILVSRSGVIGRSPLREMYLRSLYGYADWLARVESESGISVPFERGGDFQIFPLDNRGSMQALTLREKQLTREKASHFSVSDTLPSFLEPHVSIPKVRVFHFPNEAYVNNRLLLEALITALRDKGTLLLESCGPFSMNAKSHATDIHGKDWALSANQVLITAGAWCNDILKPLGCEIPLSPVKGQLAMLPNFHGDKSMIHCSEKLYLIPRGDQLICGATTEPGIWEEDFDGQGDSFLRKQIHDFFPGVKPVWTETWSGLRPRTGDRLPLMGWLNQKAGIALCTGHYKSGISLAPLAARCMSSLLNGEKNSVKLNPFDPKRKGGMISN